MTSRDLHIHDSLVEECRRGSRKAQFRLYDLYSRAMFNVAYRIINNREEAEDMLRIMKEEESKNENISGYEI